MFQATPEGIIESAKHHFMSEDFNRGFEIIRECFDENDVEDQTIFDLLMGKIGYSVEDNDVNFGEEFINDEYTEEMSEILSAYDNILEINDENYEIIRSIDFSFSHFAETSDFVTYLNENKSTLIPSSTFKYKKQMEEYGVSCLDLCDYIYFDDNAIYMFREYTKANIGGITQVKTDVKVVVEKFEERGY